LASLKLGETALQFTRVMSTSSNTSKTLLARIQSGNPIGWDEFYHTYKKLILRDTDGDGLEDEDRLFWDKPEVWIRHRRNTISRTQNRILREHLGVEAITRKKIGVCEETV